jgi:hypothetical protein
MSTVSSVLRSGEVPILLIPRVLHEIIVVRHNEQALCSVYQADRRIVEEDGEVAKLVGFGEA